MPEIIFFFHCTYTVIMVFLWEALWENDFFV